MTFLDDGPEQLFLGVEVVVERCHVDAAGIGQLSHARGVGALAGGELERRVEDALAGWSGPRRSRGHGV